MTNDAPSTEVQSPQRIVGAVLIIGGALAAGVWLSSRLDQQAGRAFPGRLKAQKITLSADQPATLREVRTPSGQRVATGEALFVLEPLGQEIESQRLCDEAERCTLEAKRLQAAAELELHWRRRDLQAEMFQTQLKLAALRQQKLHLDVEQVAWREQASVQTAFAGDESPSALFKFLGDGSAERPQAQLEAMLKEDAAASSAAAIAAQISLCEQRLVELKDLDQKLDSQIRVSLGVDAAEAQQQRAAEAIPAELAEAAQTVITSPSYGVVGEFLKQPGERLAAGEPLVQILDDERRSIDVEVPSWAAVDFTAGCAVRLEFPGRIERTGTIGALPPQTTAPLTEASGDAPIKLTISPTGKSWPQIPIGSRVLVYQP